jgi:uncharacterized membrane protein (UPF0127 family)
MGRLDRIPFAELPGGLRMHVASDPISRLFGLAHLDEIPARSALALLHCRSVHTYGMRFPLDLIWIGDELRLDRDVQPNRIAPGRGGRHVIETRAGEGELFLDGLRLALEH